MKTSPVIELNIACEGWPPIEELHKLAGEAISAITKIAKLNYPADAQLSLLFCDDEEITALNKKFRQQNKPTNVLSFPVAHSLPDGPEAEMLGDIAFSLQKIKEEAALDNKKFEHHLIHLMIHGFLHLFGYDHLEDDNATIMETLEKEALGSLGIADPYGNA
ncbi:MAG: rRNA maturation RNase YbeY [Rhizobiaceae bacterium]|nr:rRNA maturation RNase YbeY [Rhizobiaceae bacterium]